MSFDSILVRLKGGILAVADQLLASFDSILVRLKDPPLTGLGMPLNRFDSILVRLKDRRRLHRILRGLVSIPYWFD